MRVNMVNMVTGARDRHLVARNATSFSVSSYLGRALASPRQAECLVVKTYIAADALVSHFKQKFCPWCDARREFVRLRLINIPARFYLSGCPHPAGPLPV